MKTSSIRALTSRSLAALSATAMAGMTALSAAALPQNGGISMLPARSPIAEEVHVFHNWILMPIMTAISVFVLGLLGWIVIRYNSKANPKAAQFSHNTLIEVIWTGVPILILLFISLFSFELLFKEDRMPDGKQMIAEISRSQSTFSFENDFNARRTVKNAGHLDVLRVSAGNDVARLKHRKDFTVEGFGEEVLEISLNEPAVSGERIIIRGGRTRVGPGKILGLFGEDRSEIALRPTVTVKATGKQWFWQYSYPEFGDFEFIALMKPREETTEELYLYETTNHVVLPVGESIRLITTAADVIHAWAMPAFAVKIDAVPGRNNETWFKANRTGMYYGQCSEICGKDHAFMPIAVKVVTRPEFEAWVDEQRALAGMDPMFTGDNVQIAGADNVQPTNSQHGAQQTDTIN